MRPHEHCGCGRTNALPSRRSVLAGFACTGIAIPLFAAAAAAQSADDERFMRMAIEQARIADFPFGAVIVKDGKVLARGRNMGRTFGDPTAHGEMVAIRRFLDQYPPTALRGTTLYTSGEPCAMCMGAILWCHIGRLVFAASVAQLATRIDQIMLSAADVAATAKFVPIEITGGVLADEAMALFKK
jgi:tRNA(adenine34) deaminase